MRQKTSTHFHFALLIGFSALLIGCTPTINQRGNLLENYQIDEVVLGVHTRTDVLRLLGSPTTKAPFDENKWYYLGQKTAKKGVFDPEVVEERIVVATFNDEGIIQSIEDLDNERLTVPLESDSTPTQGHETTIIQEFFGNLGRFNSNQLGGQ